MVIIQSLCHAPVLLHLYACKAAGSGIYCVMYGLKTVMGEADFPQSRLAKLPATVLYLSIVVMYVSSRS